MSTPDARTLTVLPVPGHSVPVKEPDGTLVMGRFVGYGMDGKIRDRPVTLPDTGYYREQIQSGALVEYVAPVAAVEPTPELAVPAPAVSLAGLTLEDATAALTAPLEVPAPAVETAPAEKAPEDEGAKGPTRRRAPAGG